MWLEVSVLERKGTKMNEEKSWFKAFCESNRLRYRLAEDAHPVAVSAGKWKNDQFYDGFGQGIIGIYVRREGCFTIEAWAAIPIAKHLRITKHKRRVSNPKWLHEEK